MRWQAPELLAYGDEDGDHGMDIKPSSVTTQSDVYAFACVCLEVRARFFNLQEMLRQAK